MNKNKYYQYVLYPEIRQAGDIQIFEFSGKDARGDDFGLKACAVSQDALDKAVPETADADRIEMFIGGNTERLEDIGATLKITLGSEDETVNSASMVYVPKGVPCRHKVVKKSDKTGWMLNFILPPKSGQAE